VHNLIAVHIQRTYRSIKHDSIHVATHPNILSPTPNQPLLYPKRGPFNQSTSMVLLATGVSWKQKNKVKTQDKVENSFHHLPISFFPTTPTTLIQCQSSNIPRLSIPKSPSDIFSTTSTHIQRQSPRIPSFLTPCSQFPNFPISQFPNSLNHELLPFCISSFLIRPVLSSATCQGSGTQKPPPPNTHPRACPVPSSQSSNHISKVDRCG
jgi:hypothetical protein